MEVRRLVRVCVHAPMGRRLFTYELPPGLDVRPGDAVLVPFGGRELVGWMIDDSVPEDDPDLDIAKIKPVVERVDGAGIREEDFQLARSMQQIYGTNLSDIMALFVPPTAPKVTRVVESVGPLTPEQRGELSVPARTLVEIVEKEGDAAEVGRLRRMSGIHTPPMFNSALRELRNTGAFIVGARIVSVKPSQKRCIGPADLSTAIASKPQDEKVLSAVRTQPFRFSAAELSRLTGVGAAAIRGMVKRGLLVDRPSRRWSTPVERSAAASGTIALPDPTPSQARAIETISRGVENAAAETFMLYGPTASGKTLVYESAARRALALGRQVLLMVPEIALTKPLIDRIRGSIPEPVAVVHSRQTPAERRDEWQRCADGIARLLVGPRSAAFVPLPDLGLAVIDECHDAGYKQAESPYTDARRMVEEKCRARGAPVVLGSATPTVEQLYRAAPDCPMTTGRYTRLDLLEFPTRVRRPDVTVVDLRRIPRPSGAVERMCRIAFLTPELRAHIDATLTRGETTVILLNRRGFAPLVSCASCGFSMRCDSCLIGMTYHARESRAICHGCGRAEQPPQQCPVCGASPLGYLGAGTERIEDACRAVFPSAKIARLDQDVMRSSRRRAFEILDELKQGKVDILIGTQMIAKGLDEPRVTLAAVLFADVGLNLPDFRSAERTFQLLAQVIGRSGRHRAGRAIIQTFQPDHPAVTASIAEDVGSFYNYDIERRRLGLWPPFMRLIRILVTSPKAPKALQVARQIFDDMSPVMPPPATLSAPLPAPRPKIQDEYRFQMLLRVPDIDAPVPSTVQEIHTRYRQKDIKVIVEPDPITIL